MSRDIIIGVVVIIIFVGGLLLISVFNTVTYDINDTQTQNATASDGNNKQVEPIDNRLIVKHIPLPEHVKAIYMTACVAGTPSFRESLINIVEDTEVNSIIIDVKDFSGTISFPVKSDSSWYGAWQNAKCGTRDMQTFLETLHKKNIFVIGRITVFQDPYYTGLRPELAVKKADGVTVWKDNRGLSFIDVGAHEYWDHIVELTRLSYNIGFDELNFDYIRYPSDGPMNNISYTHSASGSKAENLEKFFAYLSEKVNNPNLYNDIRHKNTGRASSTPYLSADLFGFTTTNADDLSIGQIIERTFPYFDFVAPMVYPSHYPDNHLGLGNPNDHPYTVVNHAMSSGVARAVASTTNQPALAHERIGTSTPAIYKKEIYSGNNLRTWIQDFDYGGDYDAEDVRAEIQASYDAGVYSWMIWSPSNRYTKAALKPANTTVNAGQ